MPATKSVSVNLLEKDEFENSPVGRIITWATTYGRYIMILTEIVVLLAFISRFSLDRRLTDLKDEITQKQAILEANLPFEREVRGLQDQLAKIKGLLTSQRIPPTTVGDVISYMPPDVYFESMDFNGDRLSANAIAGTSEGFAQFLVNLQALPHIKSIEIGDIKKNPLKGLQFQVALQLKAG